MEGSLFTPLHIFAPRRLVRSQDVVRKASLFVLELLLSPLPDFNFASVAVRCTLPFKSTMQAASDTLYPVPGIRILKTSRKCRLEPL